MYKFENLIVWKKSVELAKSIYLFSEELKDFGLKDQLRRAVTSISINIAEGSGSQNDKEFKRYLYISRKSLFETLGCLKIIENIHLKQDKNIEEKIDEVGKLLNGLINKVKSDNESNS
ncbi:MAG: four helix bundle protein [Candidatus Roizmanbacteria bacterium]|nr:four helix bundle protein [Candidatus Roizmanbacteria bacterium]